MESNLTFSVGWGGWVGGDLESKANLRKVEVEAELANKTGIFLKN